MNEKKWTLKRLMFWGAVVLVAANSYWTIMDSRITATAGESDVKYNALSARLSEIENGGTFNALEERLFAVERRVEEMVSSAEDKSKQDEARKKALAEQIKALQKELKQLEGE